MFKNMTEGFDSLNKRIKLYEAKQAATFDYIINVSNDLEDWDPVDTAQTKKEAIETAKSYLMGRYKYAEVVYMPEDDLDTNDVIWRSKSEKDIKEDIEPDFLQYHEWWVNVYNPDDLVEGDHFDDFDLAYEQFMREVKKCAEMTSIELVRFATPEAFDIGDGEIYEFYSTDPEFSESGTYFNTVEP